MKINLTLPDSNNKRLANLCGSLDENLKQIANSFEVSLKRNGTKFIFDGEEKKIKLASKFIQTFYEKSINPIMPEDIQLGLVQYQKLPNSNETQSIQLLTKKNDIQGRTPNQIKYLDRIQNHDINFGIGPAGTGKTYLAVASAVDALNREKIKRIVLVRPAVEAG